MTSAGLLGSSVENIGGEGLDRPDEAVAEAAYRMAEGWCSQQATFDTLLPAPGSQDPGTPHFACRYQGFGSWVSITFTHFMMGFFISEPNHALSSLCCR